MTTHIETVLDIETLGTARRSVIVAVAAYTFSYGDAPDNTIKVEGTFHEQVSVLSCLRSGLSVDKSTLEWWQKQPQYVWEMVTAGQKSLRTVLQELSLYIESLRGYDREIRVWGYGKDFDQALLEDAYEVEGLREPWSYRESMCLRTVFSFHGRKWKSKEAHNPLADAAGEAEELKSLIDSFGLE